MDGTPLPLSLDSRSTPPRVSLLSIYTQKKSAQKLRKRLSRRREATDLAATIPLSEEPKKGGEAEKSNSCILSLNL